MWARIIEVLLGCWLAISPFIFRHMGNRTLWINDLSCAALVLLLSLLSFWRPLGGLHFINAAVAFWLISFGYFVTFHTAEAASQNHIMVGLLLLMLSIIPNEATRPPRPWRKFYKEASQMPESEEESG